MKKDWKILLALMVMYTVIFSWLSILRHNFLLSGRYDLGNMEQTVWNSAHGRIFQMSNPDTGETISRLSFHADFLLVLIAAVYALFPRVETLLIIQSATLALGSLFVYLLAEKILAKKLTAKTHWLPLLFAGAYLTNPIIQRANLFDFHSETLAATFLLASCYFLLTLQLWPYLLMFALALISKETVSLVLAAIAIWGITSKKLLRLNFFLLIFSVCYFLFMVKFAIPMSHPSLNRHFALRHFEDSANGGFNELLITYLQKPQKIFLIFFRPEAILYLFLLAAATGFLAILAPKTLIIAAPPILINLAVKDSQFRSFSYHYAATIMPGLVMASLYGVSSLLEKKISRSRKKILIVSVLILLVFSVLFSPAVSTSFEKNEVAGKVAFWQKEIPSTASVSATNNTGSHFANRQHLYIFPSRIDEADFIVIAGKSWQEWVKESQRDLIIGDLIADKKYRLLDHEPNFWLFAKK